MFCEHYFLPQVKNIGSIKRYSHSFPFQDCSVFHLITLCVKDFIVLSDPLKSAFEFLIITEQNILLYKLFFVNEYLC